MDNKKSLLKLLLFAGLFSTSFIGCAKTNVNELAEDIEVFFSFEDVNQTVKLSLYLDCPDTKLEINHTFCFLVMNESQDIIQFPTGLYLKLYMFAESNNTWVEIQDRVTVMGKDLVLYPKGGEEFWDYLGYVHPELPYSNVPIKIRITVVGQVEGGDERPVGAYLDVILEPEGGSTTGLSQRFLSWSH